MKRTRRGAAADLLRRSARITNGHGRASRVTGPARKCRVAGAAWLAVMWMLSGCGGSSKLQLSVARSAEFEHPTYLGVYFLSQESALNGVKIVDLIDNPEKYTEGVVGKQFVTVYPGDTKSIELENPDPRISWIEVVADFAESPCARVKRQVRSGSSLSLRVDVQEQCVEVTEIE